MVLLDPKVLEWKFQAARPNPPGKDMESRAGHH